MYCLKIPALYADSNVLEAGGGGGEEMFRIGWEEGGEGEGGAFYCVH